MGEQHGVRSVDGHQFTQHTVTYKSKAMDKEESKDVYLCLRCGLRIEEYGEDQDKKLTDEELNRTVRQLERLKAKVRAALYPATSD